MTESATDLIRHVIDRFHIPLRLELRAIEELIDAEEPDDTVEALRETYERLRDELLSHLEKEERVLFPHVVEMEEASRQGRSPSGALAGLTSGVVSVMMREHGGTQLALVGLRRITADYVPAPHAGSNRRELYSRLSALEEDLRRHMALEDGVLFPKALELERILRNSVSASGN
ncbi:MAG TPA: hemerythrin domain-containing protein [Gaiellaceae bacterium]|nr:hemerythrin domain-containing protein [Gaiellaceae bacterium]